jgi:hypothetical protein
VSRHRPSVDQAIKRGCVDRVLALEDIAAEVLCAAA